MLLFKTFFYAQLMLGIVLFLIYFLLLIVEQKWYLRKRTRPLFPRIIINFTFTACVYIVAIFLISPITKVTLHMTEMHTFGLLTLLRLNPTAHFILGFLLMDLSFYYWHRLNHAVNLLWRFHNVHHVDPDLDVTTSMRFHAVEIAYSSFFRIAQLGMIGVNPLTFFCYEFFFQANTFFHHSNTKLPIRLERVLNRIFVTPRMHGIHHSNYENETNRNFGVIFSFWDHLHKTLKLNIPQQTITIGIPAYFKPADNTLIYLLLMPFKRQRQYWKINNESRIMRISVSNKPLSFLAE